MTDAAENYEQLRSYESDFDRSQGAIRRAASVWILAAFGALAYALSLATTQGPAPLPAGFVGVLISWAAAFGIGTLWFIDQMVYQKLLHSVFVQGLFMEWRDKQLPPIRTKMFFDNLNVSGKLSLFYLTPISAFLVSHIYFSFVFETFDFPAIASGRAERIIQAILFITHLGMAGYIFFTGRNSENFVRFHGQPYPKEFTDHLRSQDSQRAMLLDRMEGNPPPKDSSKLVTISIEDQTP